MFIPIPSELLTCDYYVSEMLDLSLRFTYEALSFADKHGAKQILYKMDVMDVRLFLVEGLPSLIGAYKSLLSLSQHTLPEQLSKNYSELLKLYAMHSIAKAASKVHERFKWVDMKPWNYGYGLEYEKELESTWITKNNDIDDIDVYENCRRFSGLLDSCVNSFRDYAPCWEYHAKNATLFMENISTIDHYGCEPYTPHAEADDKKYNEIKNELLPLINASINLQNSENILMSEYIINAAGKYVVYCNERGIPRTPNNSCDFDCDLYFTPLALADTEEEARELRRELKRAINIYSSDPYYSNFQYGRCKENGELHRCYDTNDYI